MHATHWIPCGVTCAVLLTACGPSPAPTAITQAPLVQPGDAPSFVYPQRREIDGYTLLVHAPQVERWPDFKRFHAKAAIELLPPSATEPHFATATITGETRVDLPARLVSVIAPQVEQVVFSGPAPSAHADIIRRAASRATLQMPLDLFLAALAEDVLDTPTPAGFSTQAPPVFVRQQPTILLFVNGPAVFEPLEDTGLRVLVNANWPTIKSAREDSFYLLAGERWLRSGSLAAGWSPASDLPGEFSTIAADGPNAQLRAAVPPRANTQPVPAVLYTTTPAELVVIEGVPSLVAIAGAGELEHVENTSSPLFRLGDHWYLLTAGRWFRSTQLDATSWQFVAELPGEFSRIPADHPLGQVRASVPGTPEARMAALEALLPTERAVARTATPPITVSYAGAPEFESIESTGVARAANTVSDVLKVEGRYYLCHAGVWYQSAAPSGPWTIAATVPNAIYVIPPSSPAYHVTQVVVVQSSATEVVYSYPPAYSSNIYVAYGVPVYGTGWYYPPYYGAGIYYPYWGSYGHGSWYNPATGGFGSRSVYYGPYGGASYNQAYNPRTGRHGYVETAWDGDTWASHGETYNPRTGVYSETSREFDEGSQKLATDRTVQRGDASITTERTRDYDDQTQRVTREGSRGGSQQSERQVEDGALTGSSTIRTADGRTIDTQSEFSAGQGSISGTGSQGGSGSIETSRGPDGASRSGSYTAADGDRIATDTQRQGDVTRTQIESSTGGKAVSVSEGLGRTTVAQSASGDLYAGRDGNVYKKTEDGWQSHGDDGWQSVARPTASPQQTGNLEQARSGSRDRSQLDRDYSARQQGSRQFAQRGGGTRRRR